MLQMIVNDLQPKQGETNSSYLLLISGLLNGNVECERQFPVLTDTCTHSQSQSFTFEGILCDF